MGTTMKYRTLGHSGAVATSLAIGTVTFGAEADESASHGILDDYVEAGGNLIDTADVYSDGKSEEIIGRWLASRPQMRGTVMLATKGRFPMGSGPNDVGSSRRYLHQALDASLRRLGVDHIDLYQLHAWDPHTPIEESLGFLNDAITAGKISYYGLSNFTGWQLTKAVYTAKAHGWNRPITLQPQYNLLEREIESEIIPAVLDAGLGLLTWSPLAGGWLTGKYQRSVDPTGSTRLGENPKRGFHSWELRRNNERTWDIIEIVRDIADAHGVSAAQVALAWIVDRPGITSVILGVRTRDQLSDLLESTDVKLTEPERQRLTDASAPVVSNYPYGPEALEQRSRQIEGGRSRR